MARAGCPSELELDRALLGDAVARARVEAHAEGCAACQTSLAEAEAARLALAGEVGRRQVDAIALRLRDRSLLGRLRDAWRRPTSALGQGLRFGLPAAAAAAVALAVVVPSGEAPPAAPGPVTPATTPAPDAPPRPYDGLKSDADLALQVSRAGELLHDGAPLAPGTLIAYRVTVRDPGYLAVVSVEDGGAVSRIFPPYGTQAVKVDRGAVTGKGGIDASVGAERLYALYAREPFDLDAVEAAAGSAVRASGGIARVEALPVRMSQASFLFRKPGATP